MSQIIKKFVSRSISKKVLSIEQAEGMGARVRRSIGRPELRNFDPFLMLDEFKGSAPAGFPDHPHRGFETVSYILPTSKGSFMHEDFVGHKGTIGPGDLQWMTAGRGIVHSEMPVSGEIAHGLQLWINLDSANKMCDPAYQELKASDIPHVEKDGVKAIVIAGEALGVKSPVYTRVPTHYIHFHMKPHSTLHQAIHSDWNSFAYILDGEAYFGDENDANAHTSVNAHHTVTLTKGDKMDGITIRTKDKEVDFVLLAGKPNNEPIVQYGPFVMNTNRQIQEAFVDYQSGANGFENAHTWQSEIGKPLLSGERRD